MESMAPAFDRQQFYETFEKSQEIHSAIVSHVCYKLRLIEKRLALGSQLKMSLLDACFALLTKINWELQFVESIVAQGLCVLSNRRMLIKRLNYAKTRFTHVSLLAYSIQQLLLAPAICSLQNDGIQNQESRGAHQDIVISNHQTEVNQPIQSEINCTNIEGLQLAVDPKISNMQENERWSIIDTFSDDSDETDIENEFLDRYYDSIAKSLTSHGENVQHQCSGNSENSDPQTKLLISEFSTNKEYQTPSGNSVTLPTIAASSASKIEIRTTCNEPQIMATSVPVGSAETFIGRFSKRKRQCSDQSQNGKSRYLLRQRKIRPNYSDTNYTGPISKLVAPALHGIASEKLFVSSEPEFINEQITSMDSATEITSESLMVDPIPMPCIAGASVTQVAPEKQLPNDSEKHIKELMIQETSPVKSLPNFSTSVPNITGSGSLNYIELNNMPISETCISEDILPEKFPDISEPMMINEVTTSGITSAAASDIAAVTQIFPDPNLPNVEEPANAPFNSEDSQNDRECHGTAGFQDGGSRSRRICFQNLQSFQVLLTKRTEFFSNDMLPPNFWNVPFDEVELPPEMIDGIDRW